MTRQRKQLLFDFKSEEISISLVCLDVANYAVQIIPRTHHYLLCNCSNHLTKIPWSCTIDFLEAKEFLQLDKFEHYEDRLLKSQ